MHAMRYSQRSASATAPSVELLANTLRSLAAQHATALAKVRLEFTEQRLDLQRSWYSVANLCKQRSSRDLVTLPPLCQPSQLPVDTAR